MDTPKRTYHQYPAKIWLCRFADRLLMVSSHDRSYIRPETESIEER